MNVCMCIVTCVTVTIFVVAAFLVLPSKWALLVFLGSDLFGIAVSNALLI